MSTHIRILGWIHIVFGIFGLLAGVGIFAGSVLGGLFSGSLWGVFGSLIGGTLAALLVLLSAVTGIAAGYGLLQRRSWARTLMIIVSIFDLFRPWVHTIIGVYGLWVLLSSEGAAQFRTQSEF